MGNSNPSGPLNGSCVCQDRMRATFLGRLKVPMVRLSKILYFVIGSLTMSSSRLVLGPWCRARAFAVPSNNMTGAIRINLRGREPEGVVEPGAEYEAFRREIAAALTVLENPETGRPAVRWVARVEELYEGPRLRDMPDLFVEWDHGARSPRSVLPGLVA
jgi:hypothetical protein